MAQSIAELQQRISAFAAERDWDQFHDPKNLVMLLASEVGELVAEFRWLTSEQSQNAMSDPVRRDRIAREIGDVGIALLLICSKLDIDVLDAIGQKITANETSYPALEARGRPDRPGNRR